MKAKPALSSVPLHELIRNRWSPRAFDPNKAVHPDAVTALLEAARWAPSCFNDQPWRYLICDRYRDRSAWEKMLSCLAEKNQLWAHNAPLLILSVAMQHFGHNGNPNRWASYDTGAASLSLCLQAEALGLVSHQMGGFDADRCRAVFNLPEACTPMAVLAVGYQAEADSLPEDFRAGEAAERQRAALAEKFFFSEWGKAEN